MTGRPLATPPAAALAAGAGDQTQRPGLAAELRRRLERVEEALALWSAWMRDQSRPPARRKGLARPGTSLEELSALHAMLVEELDRIQPSPRAGQ